MGCSGSTDSENIPKKKKKGELLEEEEVKGKYNFFKKI